MAGNFFFTSYCCVLNQFFPFIFQDFIQAAVEKRIFPYLILREKVNFLFVPNDEEKQL